MSNNTIKQLITMSFVFGLLCILGSIVSQIITFHFDIAVTLFGLVGILALFLARVLTTEAYQEMSIKLDDNILNQMMKKILFLKIELK